MNIIVHHKGEEEKSIKQCLNRYNHTNKSIQSIQHFYDLQELLNAVKKNPIAWDLVFIDLGQDKAEKRQAVTTAAMLKQYNCNIQLVFTTTCKKHSLELYQVEHLFLLTKPVSTKYLSLAMEKAFQKLHERNTSIWPIIPVKKKQEILLLWTREVIYFRKDRRRIHIHTKSGSLSAYGKLQDYEGILNKSFLRCHNSYIVNIRYVERLKGQILYLRNGEMISVSRTYLNSFRNNLCCIFQSMTEGGVY